MTIRKKINQKLQSDSYLREIGVYVINGRRIGILYDKTLVSTKN